MDSTNEQQGSWSLKLVIVSNVTLQRRGTIVYNFQTVIFIQDFLNFSSNSEAYASELQESLGRVFIQYYMHSDTCSSVISCTTQYRAVPYIYRKIVSLPQRELTLWRRVTHYGVIDDKKTITNITSIGVPLETLASELLGNT